MYRIDIRFRTVDGSVVESLADTFELDYDGYSGLGIDTDYVL